MNESLELSYQNEWGDSERKDLLPPKDITVTKKGDMDNIPFAVEVDLDKVTEFMKMEGVTKGGDLNIILNYGVSAAYEGEKINKLPTKTIKGHMENIRKVAEAVKNTGLKIGNCRTSTREGAPSFEVTVELGKIYNTAAMFNSIYGEDVQTKFKKLLSSVLAHEIGHTRQPSNIKRYRRKVYFAIVGGAFALIDGIRRTKLPWLGQAEAVVSLAEFGAAEIAAKKLYYERAPSERFANEYKDSAAERWEKMIIVNRKDKIHLK